MQEKTQIKNLSSIPISVNKNKNRNENTNINTENNKNFKRKEFFTKLSETPDRNKKCQKLNTSITKESYNELKLMDL
jgi:hypothetical protein